jgi:hypothetical protein
MSLKALRREINEGLKFFTERFPRRSVASMSSEADYREAGFD